MYQYHIKIYSVSVTPLRLLWYLRYVFFICIWDDYEPLSLLWYYIYSGKEWVSIWIVQASNFYYSLPSGGKDGRWHCWTEVIRSCDLFVIGLYMLYRQAVSFVLPANCGIRLIYITLCSLLNCLLKPAQNKSIAFQLLH